MTPQTVPGDDDGGLSQGLDDEELHGALGQVVHIEENHNFFLNSGSSNLHCINANCKSLSLFVRVNFRKIIITLLLHPSLVFIHHKTVFTEY